jgi:hypothetical protein
MKFVRFCQIRNTLKYYQKGLIFGHTVYCVMALSAVVESFKGTDPQEGGGGVGSGVVAMQSAQSLQLPKQTCCSQERLNSFCIF